MGDWRGSDWTDLTTWASYKCRAIQTEHGDSDVCVDWLLFGNRPSQVCWAQEEMNRDRKKGAKWAWRI